MSQSLLERTETEPPALGSKAAPAPREETLPPAPGRTARRILFVHIAQGARLTGAPCMIHSFVSVLDRSRVAPFFLSQTESELRSALDRDGVPTVVLPLPPGLDVFDQQLVRPSLREAVAAVRGLVRYARELRREIRRVRPELIWVGNLRTLLTILPAALVTRVPIVWNIFLGQKSLGLLRLMNWVGILASRRIVTEYRRQASEIFTPAQRWWAGRKLRTVYTGLAAPPSPSPRSPRAMGSEFVVGHLGAFSPRKGQDLFLELARRMAASHPAARFVLAGEQASDEFAEYSRSLRETVETNGLSETVRWHGWTDEPLAFLAGLDLFVQSARDEGLPGVVREAMVAGLPVVATRVGGTAEIVVHGETGLLVDPDDPGGLVEAVAWMESHPEDAHRMGVAGRKRVEEVFSVDAFRKNYESLLLECLSRG